ncbi:protein of unknown function [Roseivivax halotolerans]|jgi:hypothetical protein|uniref:DUF4174 domain-containing protein n=1 Tax=Roseivivax halotolerans TaxID=93684 RepID=A0A1I5X6V7_9RHOB|nr:MULTISPECIES: DUF4174 domain-containing protein [Roseivivax]QFT63488.1 hypothetical protein FIU91_11175 [Roseivivax sp. THAF30]SFQ27690.1 protein of unknown function [Roseivivax halotolerans]
MTRIATATALALSLLASPLLAAEAGSDTDELIQSAEGRSLSEFEWLKRPLIVFADNPADPRYVEQMQYITDRTDALIDRDVVVLTDTDPALSTEIRRELRPRGFMLVLIAKDGTRVLRKPFPWSVRELSRSIDKLPVRQQEIRDRQGTLRD